MGATHRDAGKPIRYIAFYLPQFHRIPENDEWWGAGFTEWTNVKKARKYLKFQTQPRIPSGNRYYDLDQDHEAVMKWQIRLAKSYGIYGFCFFHYWFKDGKKLLERPVEKFLWNPSLDMPFCLSWANEPWTRIWDGGNQHVIMPQKYGGSDEWKKHFDYLLPFFRDPRYIKIKGKPVFVILKPEQIKELEGMLAYFQKQACEAGLEGIYFVAQGSDYCNRKSRSRQIDSYILYEPGYTQREFSIYCHKYIKSMMESPGLGMSLVLDKAKRCIGKAFKIKSPYFQMQICDYDQFWRRMLSRKYENRQVLPGAFLDWDNSPRRGMRRSRVFKGANPQSCGFYLKKLARKVQSETDEGMIFINAWNEWAEGTYLEPDESNGYGYLEAVRRSLRS
ncbi:MAG: glycosyl transferase [Clostridium sp.]|nr:glycosyl transferase [Clostridium sp.]